MIEQGFDQWLSLSDTARNKYMKDAEAMMKKMKGKKAYDSKGNPVDPPTDVKDYLFAAWMNDAGNQIRLLADQSPELGDQGSELVGKMIRSFIRKGKEGISDEDVILNYKAIREQVKSNFKNLGFGTKANLLARMFNVLSKFKSEKAVLDFMEEKSIPLLSKQGIVTQIFQTIRAMYKDLDFDPDDFATFTHLVDQAAKKGDNELLKKLHHKMAGKWEVYVDNLKKKVQTKSQVEKELAALGGKKEAEEGEAEEENESLKGFIKGLKL
jgi:hypothetical protein